MFGKQPPEKKSLGSILEVFTKVKTELTEFISDTSEDVESLKQETAAKEADLVTAKSSLEQVQKIVPKQ